MALVVRPESRARVSLSQLARRLAECRRLAAREDVCTLRPVDESVLKAISEAEVAINNLYKLLEERVCKPLSAIPLNDGLLEDSASRPRRGLAKRLVTRVADSAGHCAFQLAGTAGGYAAAGAQASLLGTCRATFYGVKQSVQTTWCIARPPLEQAIRYVITPAGFLVSTSTICAYGSLQLASLAAMSSAAAVTVAAASAALQTSAELLKATGGSTEVLRQALADPEYAKELEAVLAERRKLTKRQMLLQRAYTMASVLNSSVVARVSPKVSGIVSRRVLHEVDRGGLRAALESGAGALDDLLTGQRSALQESTRLALAASTWLNTSAHGKVDVLRSSSGSSVQNLAAAARCVAEYRSQGLRDGARAASRDLFHWVSIGILQDGRVSTAIDAVTSLASKPVGFVSRWLPITAASTATDGLVFAEPS